METVTTKWCIFCGWTFTPLVRLLLNILHIHSFGLWLCICNWIGRSLLRMPEFWLVITASGVLGLGISFTSMWFLHQTSATTYRYLMHLLFGIYMCTQIGLCTELLLLCYLRIHKGPSSDSTKTLLIVLSVFICFLLFWCQYRFWYSLVGSLNKIPLSIAGIVLFNVRTSVQNSLSILFGRLYPQKG